MYQFKTFYVKSDMACLQYTCTCTSILKHNFPIYRLTTFSAENVMKGLNSYISSRYKLSVSLLTEKVNFRLLLCVVIFSEDFVQK